MGPPITTAETPSEAKSGLSLASFDNSFAQLPGHFFSRQAPTPVARPALVAFNHDLAAALELNSASLTPAQLAEIFSGNILPAGAEPIAMAYAGHQFGNFVPQLGDGRAILLGEAIGQAGIRRDIQLKGSGRTVFSRGGDGRAALGPVLREYLISEAMHALGIPTTRALAAVTTGESVFRERALPGAVLTRVAASNIRVGTFQYFAARGDDAAIKTLADYVIERHYPQVKDAANPYLALFEAVVAGQASLIAQWLHVGFIHGVMNTDNMAISGETIDFGPCAFMDAYDPATVFSSIDQFGRYAYAKQPPIARWNLARFAETLLPLFDADEKRSVELAMDILNGFSAAFEARWLSGMRRKIGLRTAQEDDHALIQNLLDLMRRNAVDYTVLFRALGDSLAGPPLESRARALFAQPVPFDEWAAQWHRRLEAEPLDEAARRAAMHQVNPAYIPRNFRVEQVLAAAIEQGDYAPFREFFAVLQRPFEEQAEFAAYAEAPPPSPEPYRTFCGT